MAKFLASTILIFVAYCLAGGLGQLFAVPPNYATTIWPPSGIALAAVLMLGKRAYLGVFLGALTVTLTFMIIRTNDFDVVTMAMVSASIGFGVTLQAIVGKRLIERLMGFPNPLTREGDILGFFVLGGPIACLVGSIWSVLTLSIAGAVTLTEIATQWWIWWAGDVIGVVVFAPLALVFFGQPRYVWRPRRLTVALPLCAAFAVATVGYVYTQLSEREQARLKFERRADHVFQDIHEQVTGHLDAVHSLKSYYVGSKYIDRGEFKIFNQHVLSRHAGVQALEWLPRVVREDRKKYETLARQEGLDNFVFRERGDGGLLVDASERDEYYPVFFVEPLVSNETAIGFDVASHPVRRLALDKARDTGGQSATEPVTLVQETASQMGLLVFEPVYDKNLPQSTVAERRQAVQGFVLGVFRVGDIVHTSLRGAAHGDYFLRIMDMGAELGNRVIYSEGDDWSSHQESRWTTAFSTDLSWSATLDVADRRWRLDFRPTPEFFAAQSYRHTWLILAAGLSFTGLLGAFLLVLAGRTMRVEELVHDRTSELSETNNELGLEIEHRKQFQDALCLAHENLERRITGADRRAQVVRNTISRSLQQRARHVRFCRSVDPASD